MSNRKREGNSKIAFIRNPPCHFSFLNDTDSTLHIGIRIFEHFIKAIDIILVVLHCFKILSFFSLRFLFINPSFLFKLSFHRECFINCFSISKNNGIYSFIIIVNNIRNFILDHCSWVKLCSKICD